MIRKIIDLHVCVPSQAAKLETEKNEMQTKLAAATPDPQMASSPVLGAHHLFFLRKHGLASPPFLCLVLFFNLFFNPF